MIPMVVPHFHPPPAARRQEEGQAKQEAAIQVQGHFVS